MGLLGKITGADAASEAAGISAAASREAAKMAESQYQQTRQDLSAYRDVATGAPIYDIDPSTGKPRVDQYGNQVITGYEGGSLQELAGYGRSQVDPNQYIPGSQLPEYQRSTVTGDVSDFYGGARQAQYSGQDFDIYSDPSYQFRAAEQERAINRGAAGMGGVMSGGRLEELMARSGQMASQEYGAAYERNLRDEDLRRQIEATNYGRDVGEYGLTRAAEDARYGRDVDQYGRDLTAYNVESAREATQYGRGVDAYGRAYGEESDYLNRLAALSQTGQTATGQTAQYGSQAATQAGQAIQAAGQAEAAGVVSEYGALRDFAGDAASIYAYGGTSSAEGGGGWW